MSKKAKILIAAVTAAAIILLVFIIYAIFFRRPPAPPVPAEPPVDVNLAPLPEAVNAPPEAFVPLPPQQLPAIAEIAAGGVTRADIIADFPALDVTLAPDGSRAQFYNQADGRFYRVNDSGELSQLSENVFFNVQKVTWSPDGNKAVLEYPDEANIIFDFRTEQPVTLPRHWEGFSFSPQGDRLAFKSIGQNMEDVWLASSDTNGSSIRRLEHIGGNENHITVDWSPNGQSVAEYYESYDGNSTDLFFIGFNDENFKSARVQGRGLTTLWDRDGDRLVYSVYNGTNDFKPRLYVMDAKGAAIGNNNVSLGLETWADKCALSPSDDDVIYCAVPRNLEAGSGFFRPAAADNPDDLYEVNIRTGLRKLLAIPDAELSMRNLSVTDDGSTIYFMDSFTGQIRKMDLK